MIIEIKLKLKQISCGKIVLLSCNRRLDAVKQKNQSRNFGTRLGNSAKILNYFLKFPNSGG